MFGTSGIRGPVGEAVTADLALRVGRALGAETGRVVVGRDPRDSGAMLVDAPASGCRELGTDVVDVGLAATPTSGRGTASGAGRRPTSPTATLPPSSVPSTRWSCRSPSTWATGPAG